ncbi:MAG: electron transfer flavoprotein beta subunit [Sphingobacteriales bacterium]|jgi:electron transfer flavoprotein beta subunit
MKILVCISHVQDTTTKINFTDNNTKFDKAGVQFIVNPYDEIALTRALEISEANSGTVTVINVGEADTDATIRKALAIGANEAVRINSVPGDAYFVAEQIANYAKEGGFDIILTGRESIDYNGSQIPAMIGEFLNIPSISNAKSLILEGEKAILEREIEGGKEIIETELPFVASALEGMAEPRIPNMRGIMSARSKPLNVIEPTGSEPLVEVTSFEKPTPRSEATMVDAGDMKTLVELLHTEAKVI